MPRIDELMMLTSRDVAKMSRAELAKVVSQLARQLISVSDV